MKLTKGIIGKGKRVHAGLTYPGRFLTYCGRRAAHTPTDEPVTCQACLKALAKYLNLEV